jgi:hypothetical protein
VLVFEAMSAALILVLVVATLLAAGFGASRTFGNAGLSSSVFTAIGH